MFTRIVVIIVGACLFVFGLYCLYKWNTIPRIRGVDTDTILLLAVACFGSLTLLIYTALLSKREHARRACFKLFTIHGHDEKTGESKSITINATDDKDAYQRARKQGLVNLEAIAKT